MSDENDEFVGSGMSVAVEYCHETTMRCRLYLVTAASSVMQHYQPYLNRTHSVTAYFGSSPTVPVSCQFINVGTVNYTEQTVGQLTGTANFAVLTCEYKPKGVVPMRNNEYSDSMLEALSVSSVV